jgi:hypothetical protein
VLTEKSAGRRSPRRRGRAIPGVDLTQARQPAAGVGAGPTDPVPDPDWDRVTLASWASFPASEAPGWR